MQWIARTSYFRRERTIVTNDTKPKAASTKNHGAVTVWTATIDATVDDPHAGHERKRFTLPVG
jgi:hypothetical protein